MSEPEFKRDFDLDDLKAILKSGSPLSLRKYSQQRAPEQLGDIKQLSKSESDNIRKLSAIQFNNGDLLDLHESEKLQREMFE